MPDCIHVIERDEYCKNDCSGEVKERRDNNRDSWIDCKLAEVMDENISFEYLKKCEGECDGECDDLRGRD